MSSSTNPSGSIPGPTDYEALIAANRANTERFIQDLRQNGNPIQGPFIVRNDIHLPGSIVNHYEVKVPSEATDVTLHFNERGGPPRVRSSPVHVQQPSYQPQPTNGGTSGAYGSSAHETTVSTTPHQSDTSARVPAPQPVPQARPSVPPPPYESSSSRPISYPPKKEEPTESVTKSSEEVAPIASVVSKSEPTSSGPIEASAPAAVVQTPEVVQDKRCCSCM